MSQTLTLLQTYSQDDVIAYYADYVDLQKPEQTILGLLAPRLPTMRMLEVGVGAGRVTRHFAGRVREYQGIDLCPRMIWMCRRSFPGPERFSVRDMRDLDAYETGRFDLLLITYNTLDHLSEAERGRFLREARRVIAPGGCLCFSSHNIACLADWLSLRRWLGFRLWRWPRQLRQRAQLKQLNQAALEQHARADCVVITNGTHGSYEMRSCYVRTAAQVRRLNEAGFDQVRVFSLDSGRELQDGEIAGAKDRWLYYLAS
jgi:SAM-dependent methyltransferase